MPTEDPIIPYFDSFVKQTGVPNLFTIELCDIKDKDNVAGGYGRMAIGGLLPTRMNGTLYYTPLKAHSYYSVAVTRVKVGDTVVGSLSFLFSSGVSEMSLR